MRHLKISFHSIVFAIALAPNAIAQTPVVFNKYVPSPTGSTMHGPIAFTDIPETVQTVDIPAGTAVLTWTLRTQFDADNFYRLRPAIGDSYPPTALFGKSGVNSGSWSTETAGGTISVRLQAAIDDSSLQVQIGDTDSLMWTLIVFPQPNNGAPALGTVGLIIMMIGLVIAGGFILKCRRGFSPTSM